MLTCYNLLIILYGYMQKFTNKILYVYITCKQLYSWLEKDDSWLTKNYKMNPEGIIKAEQQLSQY